MLGRPADQVRQVDAGAPRTPGGSRSGCPARRRVGTRRAQCGRDRCGGGMPSRATATNRVWLPSWSAMSAAITSSPYSSAAARGAIAAMPGVDVLAHDLRGRRRRVGRAHLRSWQLLAEETMALGGCDRDRQHVLHVGERRTRAGDQAVLDVEHHLAGDDQVVVERERVEREVDHALDRVLDRHEADTDITAGDRVEDVRHRPVRDQLTRREVGLGTQRLLGERAERPEEPDPLRRVGGRARIDQARSSWAPRLRALPRMGAVDDSALRALIDGIRSGEVTADEAVARALATAVRRPRRRARRPPPHAAPGHARGGVRPGQDAGAVRAHRRRAARARQRAGAADAGRRRSGQGGDGDLRAWHPVRRMRVVARALRAACRSAC